MSDPQRDFARSRRFGLVGVGGVAVVVAAIALVFGQGSANPTGALIAIIVVIFGFVAVLLYLQRRDLDSAASRSLAETQAAIRPVADPTLADPVSLIAALATGPVDRSAIGAGDQRMWALGRQSISSGAVMMVLIFCAFVPWQLWQATWALVTFGSAVVLYAVYLAVRVLMPGGSLEQAYDNAGPTLAALGLTETSRPQVEIRQRAFGPTAMTHELEGALIYEGERRGRQVSVTIGTGSLVQVLGAVKPFNVRAHGERLRAADGAPPGVAAVLKPLRASSYWKGVSAGGGAEGVAVERTQRGAEHWLCDLWLAERLADAAG